MKFYGIDISEKIEKMASEAEADIKEVFEKIDSVAMNNTAKVMAAFRKYKVAENFFYGTTGYGYDDKGRDELDNIYAEVFGAEAGLVRIGFVNGTHAIAASLFSMLRPGDVLLSATGMPYDTIRSTIGIEGNYPGSMKQYGIEYRQVDLLPDSRPDIEKIKIAASDKRVREVMVQRSRGYSSRNSISVADIGRICDAVHEVNPNAYVIVDNCYGEFVEEIEPTNVGADLMAGSLIKNPGGALAPTGGYIVGKRELVEASAMRLTTPGIGGECGSTLGNNRLLYQGFFMAPHTVAQALKTAVFCARMMEKMGYKSFPASTDPRSDIVQVIELGSGENLVNFCRGIQSAAPVDSFVAPEPWAMPGYNDPVVMAAGAFIQGASIELSADGPMREPYFAYLQGGITYESGKLGIMIASELLLKNN